MNLKSARFGLAVLCTINLLNYTDRYILAGVMSELQKTFALTDTQGGQLASIFMLVYMFASPLGGYLGDRLPRHVLIGISVIVWSLATLASGLATGFVMLLAARALTGFGEAGYGSVAPAVISDWFTKEERSKRLSLFYAAMPLGAALGYALGLLMEHDWRHAFMLGGLPGLALGALAFFIGEPPRGALDANSDSQQPRILDSVRALSGNGRYVLVVASLTLMTFSIGGLSIWMPKFLSAERGFSPSEAAMGLGAATILGGVLGTLAGGTLGHWAERRASGGSILLSAFGLLLASPFMLAAAWFENKSMVLASLLLAQFFVFLNNGPLNAAILNVVPPQLRAFAFGMSMLVMHLLGDAISPTLIGWISDQSSLGTAIVLNAIPVALGGLVLFPAARLFRHRSHEPS